MSPAVAHALALPLFLLAPALPGYWYIWSRFYRDVPKLAEPTS